MHHYLLSVESVVVLLDVTEIYRLAQPATAYFICEWFFISHSALEKDSKTHQNNVWKILRAAKILTK